VEGGPSTVSCEVVRKTIGAPALARPGCDVEAGKFATSNQATNWRSENDDTGGCLP